MLILIGFGFYFGQRNIILSAPSGAWCYDFEIFAPGADPLNDEPIEGHYGGSNDSSEEEIIDRLLILINRYWDNYPPDKYQYVMSFGPCSEDEKTGQ